MRLFLAPLCFAFAGAVPTAATAQIPPDFTRTAAIDALNAYEDGRYDAASTFLQRVADWVTNVCHPNADSAHTRVYRDVARRFARNAGAWILEAREEGRGRRTRIAAVVALEVAGLAASRSGPARECLQWADARLTLEWACGLLRSSGPPTPFERLWHHAAFAIIQRAVDTEFTDHAAHVIVRFPETPRFTFAALLVRPELQAIGAHPGLRPEAIVAKVGVARPATRQDLDRTLAALDAIAAAHPELARESRLRAGVLRFLLGDLARSLEDFQAIATRVDANGRYIIAMITAAIHDARGEPERAAEALRGAVAESPGAPSARLALAARLFASGDVEEATSLVGLALDTAFASDPWRHYGDADGLYLPRYLEALRTALQ